MSGSSNKVEAVIKECKRLIDLTSNAVVQEKLKELLESSNNELASLRSAEKLAAEKGQQQTSKPLRPLTKITNYSYEDNESKLKLYLNISGAKEAPAESFQLNVESNSVCFKATNVNGRDYEFILKGLFDKVIPEECNFKQKTDMILITLSKAKKEKWTSVLKLNEKKKNAFSAAGDESNPQESIMNLMREMYENGDNEMRKTIGEAMLKARDKPGSLGSEFMNQ
ncbi:Calcyclin-binding protein [Strongyloides ratti]|uniref:Calcyclin-binding protein n=1 Tax=Strongyloides ratti TaxID=34506 RepID=A0A090LLR4_STRRB|nr:Calcyclin-binding protein [Strongyloides ratti]CEF69108.1 Calcyclin-binding protein [Strongyloides ratti]